MKGEVHVMIIKLPIEELLLEAQKQVPEGYVLVDSEFVDNDAAYFSFQKQEDDKIITITAEEN
jgi:hypothetical protein